MSRRLDVRDAPGREDGVLLAADAVRRGEVVVLPTDTVYGVGADAFDRAAVRAVLAAKGRGRDMPPPVLVPSQRVLDGLAYDVPAYARDLVDAFWPGGLTIVCQAQPSLDWDLGDTGGTVAVRMPLHRTALALLDRDRPDGRDQRQPDRPAGGDHLRRGRGAAGRGGLGLPGRGARAGGVASTIVDVTGGRPRLLRAGVRADLGGRVEPWPSLAVPVGPPSRAREAARVREYLFVLVMAAAVTYIATPLVRWFAFKVGALAAVRDRDVHAEPMPRLGGVGHVPRASPRRCCWPGTCRSCPRSTPRASPGRAARAPGWSAPSASSTTCAGWTRSPSWPASCSPRADGLPGDPAAVPAAVRRHRPADAAPGRPHRPGRRGDDQRGELRRRPGRPGRGDRRHRRRRLLRLLLPVGPGLRPQRLQRGVAHHRRADRLLRRASCRTTSTRPGSSWATRARCCSACCWRRRRSR